MQEERGNRRNVVCIQLMKPVALLMGLQHLLPRHLILKRRLCNSHIILKYHLKERYAQAVFHLQVVFGTETSDANIFLLGGATCNINTKTNSNKNE